MLNNIQAKKIWASFMEAYNNNTNWVLPACHWDTTATIGNSSQTVRIDWSGIQIQERVDNLWIEPPTPEQLEALQNHPGSPPPATKPPTPGPEVEVLQRQLVRAGDGRSKPCYICGIPTDKRLVSDIESWNYPLDETCLKEHFSK